MHSLGARHGVNMSVSVEGDFGTHPEYNPRAETLHFDDTANEDNWQDEVYRYAGVEFAKRGFRRVVDVGCGSGFKLVKYFGPGVTVGLELDPALSFVRQRYPGRDWRSAQNLSIGLRDADMVICSDVIEHLADPAELLSKFADCPAELFVISTPALEILVELGGARRLGPPINESHAREWTTVEFGRFVSRYLKVVSHHVTSVWQGTQMVIATKK